MGRGGRRSGKGVVEKEGWKRKGGLSLKEGERRNHNLEIVSRAR